MRFDQTSARLRLLRGFHVSFALPIGLNVMVRMVSGPYIWLGCSVEHPRDHIRIRYIHGTNPGDWLELYHTFIHPVNT